LVENLADLPSIAIEICVADGSNSVAIKRFAGLAPIQLPVFTPNNKKMPMYEIRHKNRAKEDKSLPSRITMNPVATVQDQHCSYGRINMYYDVTSVEEYQDTNQIQHNLLQVLHGGSVMAIGDCDQTIFEYRGSDPRFILQYFYDNFPGTVTYTLPDTFRFDHKPALLYNHLTSHNKQRDDTLYLSRKSAPPTDIHRLKVDDYAEETLAVVKKQLRDGAKPEDITILTRVWAISAAVELLFLTEGIPYSS